MMHRDVSDMGDWFCGVCCMLEGTGVKGGAGYGEVGVLSLVAG